MNNKDILIEHRKRKVKNSHLDNSTKNLGQNGRTKKGFKNGRSNRCARSCALYELP